MFLVLFHSYSFTIPSLFNHSFTGDRARFQLFGDTVNTAARMESTGVAGRVQISEGTAACLRAADKHSWLSEREGGVEAKGKGCLKTYWLQSGGTNNSILGSKGSVTASSTTHSSDILGDNDDDDDDEADEVHNVTNEDSRVDC